MINLLPSLSCLVPLFPFASLRLCVFALKNPSLTLKAYFPTILNSLSPSPLSSLFPLSLSLFLAFILFLSSTLNANMQEINGRDNLPIYRIKAPQEWIRRDPLPEESLSDTTKPLCEYLIYDYSSEETKESKEIIRITIHDFPFRETTRIPPLSQVSRWEQQFDVLDVAISGTSPQSFSGYSGLLFMGYGTFQGKQTGMLAWALQLPPEHCRMIDNNLKNDITIKAIGPKDLINKYHSSIITMARSFELIKEIPVPL